jgi:hypothetical protein
MTISKIYVTYCPSGKYVTGIAAIKPEEGCRIRKKGA